MPYSRNQRIAAAIAEHHPEKLYARNAGMLNMSHGQLHDFASGPIQPAGSMPTKQSKVRLKLASMKDPIEK